jgi:hypothetical protein
METSDSRPGGGPAPAAGLAPARGGWLRSAVIVVLVDVAAPLAVYNGARAAGLPAVTALVLGGVFPALGLALSAVRRRRLDVAGALVLAGIAVGAVLGLTFHSARLVMAEGSVPTAVFGAGCLGSLRRRPLIYGLALEFSGPDSDRGREMSSLWRYDGYRQVWRVITATWGASLIAESALRVVIIFTTSAGTATAVSKATPFVFFCALSAWTAGYGSYRKRKGERLGHNAALAAAEQSPPRPLGRNSLREARSTAQD